MSVHGRVGKHQLSVLSWWGTTAWVPWKLEVKQTNTQQQKTNQTKQTKQNNPPTLKWILEIRSFLYWRQGFTYPSKCHAFHPFTWDLKYILDLHHISTIFLCQTSSSVWFPFFPFPSRTNSCCSHTWPFVFSRSLWDIFLDASDHLHVLLFLDQ